MKLTFEITKNIMGDSEVFLLKCVEKNTEKVLKSSAGMGDWIREHFNSDSEGGD